MSGVPGVRLTLVAVGRVFPMETVPEFTGVPASVPSLGVMVKFHCSPLAVFEEETEVWSFSPVWRTESLYQRIWVPVSPSESASE